jgi:thioredoxin 2
MIWLTDVGYGLAGEWHLKARKLYGKRMQAIVCDELTTQPGKHTMSLHIVCPHCDAVNRVPAERLAQKPDCGRCHRALLDTTPLEVNAAQFERYLTRNDTPLLVDFWAPWCGPCKMMAPAFEQAAAQLEPHVRLLKVNTEAEQALGARYGIRSIPTLAIFHQGKEVQRQAGAMGAAAIVQWTRNVLAARQTP